MKNLSRAFLLFALLFLASRSPVHGENAKPAIPEDVKANVRARVDAGQTPSIVVGLIVPGGEVYHAAGVLKVGGQDAVDPDTIYEIGSITKTFTGALLADMVRRGEVKLDDPVQKYLPETVKVPREGERQITLLDLATQRSGLARMPDNLAPADPEDPYVDYTVERLYAYLSGAKLAHPIGTTYDYSNLGVGLLGHALCRVAGMDFDTLVRTRITTPLGMPTTSLEVAPSNLKRLAQGHSRAGGPLSPAKPWTWRATSCCSGAGGLRSTAREMLRYVAANAGLTETTLSPALMDTHKERADAGTAEMGIGLAWHLRKSARGVIVWHNGGTGGFRSFCGFDPKTKTGVVVLTNSTEDIDDIGSHLLDPSLPLVAPPKEVVVDEAKLARLDGWYDLGGPKIQVTHEGPQLYAQVSGQQRFPVFSKSETLFYFRVVPAELEFDVQADGTVKGLTLHQGGRDLVAPRLAADAAPKERAEVPVDAKLLAEYAGKYAFAPGVVLDVAVTDGRLTCQLTGQPRFDLFAESTTTFFLKVVDAQLTFVRDEAGKFASVILHQGGRDQTGTRAE